MNNDAIVELLDQKYRLNKDMLKVIIEAIPANVFFKDTSCKYQMVSHLCNNLNGGNEEYSIVGKTDLDIQPDPEFGKFFYEDDMKILETKKGNRYISEMIFNGEKYYYEIIKTPVIDIEGEIIGIVGLVNDLTEIKRLQEELRLIGITDQLTKAYNRTYFEQKITELKSMEYSNLSIIMCDTNGLKYLNDNHGHQKGDALLIETTRVLKKVIGNKGEVMRIGGDEFFILCLDCSEEHCEEIIKLLKEEEKESTILGLPISSSYGYATIERNDKDFETAFKHAEIMMYKEKAIMKRMAL